LNLATRHQSIQTKIAASFGLKVPQYKKMFEFAESQKPSKGKKNL